MPPPCEVWFYHLERTGADQVLAELLEKTLAKGWRAIVRSPDGARRDQLDQWLWTYRDDSFLAHGLAEEPHAESQPVLITDGEQNPNGAKALFLLDHAEPGDLSSYARCMILFDGRDETAVAAARSRWVATRAAGHSAAYWRQSDRGWEKQG